MTSTSSQDGITRTWLALMQKQQKIKQNVWKIVFKTRCQAIMDSVPWGIGEKWCEPCSCCSSLSWDNLQEGKLRWRPGRFAALRRWSLESRDTKTVNFLTHGVREEKTVQRESPVEYWVLCACEEAVWGWRKEKNTIRIRGKDALESYRARVIPSPFSQTRKPYNSQVIE